jgi:hypothetical protein
MKKIENGVELKAADAQKKYKIYFYKDGERTRKDVTYNLAYAGAEYITLEEWENLTKKWYIEYYEKAGGYAFETKEEVLKLFADNIVDNILEKDDIVEMREYLQYHIEALELLEKLREGEELFVQFDGEWHLQGFDGRYDDDTKHYYIVEVDEEEEEEEEEE